MMTRQEVNHIRDKYPAVTKLSIHMTDSVFKNGTYTVDLLTMQDRYILLSPV